MSPTYEKALTVLSRYLSRLNSEVMLERALRRMDLTPDSLNQNHLGDLIAQLERSLSLFVDHTKLPRLLGDLKRDEVAPDLKPRVINVLNEADLSEARLEARQICEDMGAPPFARQKVATLVSELARNIVLYAGDGRIELVPLMAAPKRIIVRASDKGPGIPNLQQILAGDYKSKTGLGVGLRGCKRLANRFDIETGSWGTRVEAEIHV